MTKKQDGSYGQKLKKLSKDKAFFKKASIQVVVIALVFLLGLWIGKGRIEFGVNGLVSFSGGQNGGLPASLNYSNLQQEYNLIKTNFDGKLTISQLQDGSNVWTS